MKSSNIAQKGFEKARYTHSKIDAMSISGTFNKAILLTLIVLIFGAISWAYLPIELLFPLLIITFVAGLGVILFLAFKPHLAKFFVFPYAIVEGVFLGLVSKLFEMMYPGIVIQAVVLTIIIALLMNVLYQNRIIKVTEKFRSIMTAAILSILFIYVISFVLMLFEITFPYIHSSGPIGILFSIVVVIIASLTFLLDFDMIEKFSNKGLHKDYEWYGAFSLLITLVWLYIELLKLLSKVRRS